MKNIFTVLILILLAFIISNCKKEDKSGNGGKWNFTITYTPTAGSAWSEYGSGDVTVTDTGFTMNVTMSTGETYVRYGKINGSAATLIGGYTQPVASNPAVSETVTYNGTGLVSGSNFNASGVYSFTIPAWSTSENGTFVLTANK